MFDLPLVAFDIETTPNPDIGRRFMGLSGDDAGVIRQMMALRSEETEGRTEYPVQAYHRVICTCATVLDPKSGRVEMLHLGAADLWDEASQVGGFYDLVERRGRWADPPAGAPVDVPFRLASWNGAGFDLPILRYRAMAHGIVAADFNRKSGSRKYDHYLARFGTLHVDLMDELSSFGAAPRAGLDAVAKSLGYPSKAFLSRPIVEHLLDGDHESIAQYCKLDTLITLLVYLSWGRHAGWVSGDAYERATEGARRCVAAEGHAGWGEIRW